MSRDETLPSLPEDVRFPLEGEGRRLEAIEFVQSSPGLHRGHVSRKRWKSQNSFEAWSIS